MDAVHKPFAHLFPMLIVGSDVPWVEQLDLYQLDWITTRPHISFFDYLGCYSRTTTLWLMKCRFYAASQLRRLINALPNLEMVSLLSIDERVVMNALDNSQTSSHGPELKANPTLSCIELSVISDGSDHWVPSESGATVQSILAVCGLYQTVTKLKLHINLFDSLSGLAHFLHSFPRLHTLSLDAPQCLTGIFWQANVDAETLPTACPRLHTLTLDELPVPCSIDVMNLIALPRMSDTVAELEILMADDLKPTAELMDAIMRALSRSGSALMELTVMWKCHLGLSLNHHSAIPFTHVYFVGWPQLRLASNTSLEGLTVTYHSVPANIRTIEDGLVSLISSITSPYLTMISVSMTIAFEGYDGLAEGTDHARDFTVFHTFLDTSFSLGQHSVSMFFRIPSSQSTRAAVLTFTTLLTTRLSISFAPWANNGILQFRLDTMSRPDEGSVHALPSGYIVDDSGKLSALFPASIRARSSVRCYPEFLLGDA